MENIKRALELRKKMKKSLPDFIVKEAKHQGMGLEKRWRYPHGRHSGVRQRHKGKQALPSPGYGSPALVRGLHHSGLEMVVICNVPQLLKLDPLRQGAIISGGVGQKKKLEILHQAQEKKIRVLNVKNPAQLVEKIKKAFTARLDARKKRSSEKSQKEEEKRKKAEEKEKKVQEEKKKAENAPQSSVEEKIKEEKEELRKEQEKIITKKQ